MASNKMASGAQQRQMGSSGALKNAEDLKQRLDEFGTRLRQIKGQEPAGPSREWLEEAERRHQMLEAALDDYLRERAAQRPDESACERAGRKVQTCYQSCDECLEAPRTGARDITKDIRGSWAGVANAFDRAYGLTNAFDRAFGRDQQQQQRATRSVP
jgi:hypothetical protein